MGGMSAGPLSSAVEDSARERNARRIKNETSRALANVFMIGPNKTGLHAKSRFLALLGTKTSSVRRSREFQQSASDDTSR